MSAQETNDSIQNTDTINYSEMKFNLFMLDVNYTSNNIETKGDNPDIQIPAFITDISFLHKTGLSAGLMFTNYSGADTFSYDADFLLGYQHYFFNELIDIDLGYLYHTYSGADDFKGIDFNHAIVGSLGFTYEFVYLYGDGKFHLDDKNYFTDFGLTFSLDFENIFFKDDYFFFMPTAAFNFGTDYWMYEIYKPYIDEILIPLIRYKYPYFNRSSEEMIERYMERQGVSTNTYSYHGADIVLPITYGFGSVSISYAYMYYFPSDKLELFGMNNQSGHLISLSFIF